MVWCRWNIERTWDMTPQLACNSTETSLMCKTVRELSTSHILPSHQRLCHQFIEKAIRYDGLGLR